MREDVPERQLLARAAGHWIAAASHRCPAVEVIGVAPGPGGRPPVTRATEPEGVVPSCFAPEHVVWAGLLRENRADDGRRVRAVRVHAPAAPDLHVIVERATTGLVIVPPR